MTIEEMRVVAILFFKMMAKLLRQAFGMMDIYYNYETSAYDTFCSRGDNGKISTCCFMTDKKTRSLAIILFSYSGEISLHPVAVA